MSTWCLFTTTKLICQIYLATLNFKTNEGFLKMRLLGSITTISEKVALCREVSEPVTRGGISTHYLHGKNLNLFIDCSGRVWKFKKFRRTESWISSQCYVDLALLRTFDKPIMVYDVVLREVTRAFWEFLTSALRTRGQGARQGGEQKKSNETISYQGGRYRNILNPPPHHVFGRTIAGRQSNNKRAFLILIS